MREDEESVTLPRNEIAEESLVRHALVALVWCVYLPVSMIIYRVRGGHRRLVAEQFAVKYHDRSPLSIETKKLPRRKILRSVIRDNQGEDHTLDFNTRDEVWTWIDR